MKLNEEQRIFLENSVKKGTSLSQLQDAFNKQFESHLTYMELRCLVADLELELQDTLKKSEEKKEENFEEAPPASKVSLRVDPIARPGVLFSGSVIFSDGVESSWQLDEMGRLGLVPSQKGYRPSKEDLQEFQSLLQGELQKGRF